MAEAVLELQLEWLRFYKGKALGKKVYQVKQGCLLSRNRFVK